MVSLYDILMDNIDNRLSFLKLLQQYKDIMTIWGIFLSLLFFCVGVKNYIDQDSIVIHNIKYIDVLSLIVVCLAICILLICLSIYNNFLSSDVELFNDVSSLNNITISIRYNLFRFLQIIFLISFCVINTGIIIMTLLFYNYIYLSIVNGFLFFFGVVIYAILSIYIIKFNKITAVNSIMMLLLCIFIVIVACTIIMFNPILNGILPIVSSFAVTAIALFIYDMIMIVRKTIVHLMRL